MPDIEDVQFRRDGQYMKLMIDGWELTEPCDYSTTWQVLSTMSTLIGKMMFVTTHLEDERAR